MASAKAAYEWFWLNSLARTKPSALRLNLRIRRRLEEDVGEVRQNLGVGVTGRRAGIFLFGIGHERRPVLVARRQVVEPEQVGEFRQDVYFFSSFLASNLSDAELMQ